MSPVKRSATKKYYATCDTGHHWKGPARKTERDAVGDYVRHANHHPTHKAKPYKSPTKRTAAQSSVWSKRK